MHRKICKTYGCRGFAVDSKGYCESCMQTHFEKGGYPKGEAPRESASKRGYSWEWTKFARKFVENHPVCAMCGAPSQVCDHMDMPADIMLKMYGRFDLDERHYQALCQRCNNLKGRTTDRKIRKDFHDELAELKEISANAEKNHAN